MLTLATCRKLLWNYASSVPYPTATMADVANFDTKLAQVCERFFSIGTWKSMWNKVNLAVYDGRITLPRGFDTCRSIVESCGGPTPIYSQFHRFAGYGVSCDISPIGDCGTGMQLLDENAQTFRIPSGIFTLRAVATEVADPGLTMIGGFDENENEIYGSINLALVNGSSNGAQQYTALPYINKVVTLYSVSLYAVDTTTAEATLIAVYAPGEVIPEYRQYSFAPVTTTDEDDPPIVSAICKLSFVPALTANDLIIPSNLGALRLGLQALTFEERVDPVNAAIYWGGSGKMMGAVDLLNAELAELQAAEQPAFHVSPHFGLGSIPSLI